MIIKEEETEDKKDKRMFSVFKGYPVLFATFSEKGDGSMRLMGDAYEKGETVANRRNFFAKHGILEKQVVGARLAHTKKVETIGVQSAGTIIDDVDGLVTNARGIYLSITAADCLPIYLFDKKKEVIGLIHAGWRGISTGILGETVRIFTEKFDADPGDILVGIGPGICQSHFEVGKDVAMVLHKAMKNSWKKIISDRNGHYFLDLKSAASLQLQTLGLESSQIEIFPDCTYELFEKYFSFRRDKPKDIEAMVAIIGIKE